MNEGAFALIDCLGFKGLWRNGHDELLDKLRRVKETVNSGIKTLARNHLLQFNPDFFVVEVRLLSDTVAISVTQRNKEDAFSSLLAITTTIQALIDLFLEREPYLFLRGCVTYGKHHIEENYLVGQAVDDAAEYMDSAQGALIWFLPGAATIIEDRLASMKDKDLLYALFDCMCPQYPIPIKGGGNLVTRMINPLFNKPDDVATLLVDKCQRVMSTNKMDVWMKQQNTIKLLSYCTNCNNTLSKLIEERKKAKKNNQD